jgi:hypothetical protein
VPPTKDPGPLTAGFIAEELEEVGLDLFVTRDEQGRPEGVSYDRLTTALLLLVKKQQEQIDDLTQRVAVLEGGI